MSDPIRDRIERILLSHRLTHQEIEDSMGDGLPLVDALSVTDDISTGREEIELLADAIAGDLEEERERAREEAMAAVETWARRIIGNAQIHAEQAKVELDRDEDEHGDHSLERTALRHAGGHLHRLVEILSQPLPDPAPEAEEGGGR